MWLEALSLVRNETSTELSRYHPRGDARPLGRPRRPAHRRPSRPWAGHGQGGRPSPNDRGHHDPGLLRQPDVLAAAPGAPDRAAEVPPAHRRARHRPDRDPRAIPHQSGGTGRPSPQRRPMLAADRDGARCGPASPTCISARTRQRGSGPARSVGTGIVRAFDAEAGPLEPRAVRLRRVPMRRPSSTSCP